MKCLYLLLLFSTNCIAQNVYLIDYWKSIYSLNSDNSLQFHCTINGINTIPTDIAFSDNTLYGIEASGSLYEIDIDTGNTILITSFPVGLYTSLAGNNQNELFSINNTDLNLYKYNVATDTLTLISHLGYGTGGDLSFFKGNLIFPPIDAQAEILAYNIIEDTIYDFYCPDSFPSVIYGIVNDCQFCETDNKIIVATPLNLYELNIEEGTISEIPVSLTFEIWGLASTNEIEASTCNAVLIDKNCDCPNPTEDITPPIPDLNELPILTGLCSIEQLTQPTANDNCDGAIVGNTTISLPITASTNITWTFTDSNGNFSTQSQQVIIEDAISPIPDLSELPILTVECSIEQLTQPTANDNCDGAIVGNTTISLPITASTNITWTFTDSNGNFSTQSQQVIIEDAISPIPDLSELPILTEECSIEQLTQPTANDNCDGAIAGNTTISLPITASTNITWTFTDSNGNFSTQSQQVIIEDAISPIPDLSELPILTGQCSIEQLTQPTANDNCDGDIVGNTTIGLPITTSTNITWTFVDSNGNFSTQSQQVIIEDTILPIPDLSELPILTGQCSIEQLTQPTANDNCEGAIVGNTTISLPITASTNITWTFADSNGNFSTQIQQVIIEDTISPIPNLNELPILTEQCSIEQLTQPIANDNCDGSIVGNTTISLPITSSSNITWTFVDSYGNSSTQSQQVTIDCSQNNFNIYPNPFTDNIYLDLEEDILSVYLFDMNGRIIYEIADSVTVINTRQLSSNVYFLKVQTNSSIKIFKMIKQ
ncbi:T9SS type A sorting domain-containing protein [Ulvibacter antarcticus]|uniref:Putative secreted protein (Por secretion system target) n=1 Tax=Ulvibacter antarcticus TaxID=442714 RepID=A0A3L9YBN8_9FLAO|nr:T9SS type A sorting domain-containing protein [Ulvibacter antarcticus]RMA58086.1 putative secreted protein (Por secretion system target) [Ulvibacter antarcticus]